MDKRIRALQVDIANLKEEVRALHEYQVQVHKTMEKLINILLLKDG